MGSTMISTGVAALDGDTHTITIILTTVMATHIMGTIITMALTTVLQNAQTTTMVVERLWGLKLEQTELIQIEGLQPEQTVL